MNKPQTTNILRVAALIAVVIYIILPVRFSYYFEKDGKWGYGYFTAYDFLAPSGKQISEHIKCIKDMTGDDEVQILSWQKIWDVK